MWLLLLSLLHLSLSVPLENLLRSYTTLHRDDVIIKYFPNNVALVSIQIDDQTYTASCIPHPDLFHKHFRTILVSNNSTSRLSYPTEGHYLGSIDGAEDSRAVFHIDPSGLVTGNIEIGGELYYIEPSWRHVTEPHDYHMIMYKKSDVLYNLGDYCGAHDAVYDGPVFLKSETESDEHVRFRRGNSNPQDTCEVILIADYRFFTDIGGGNEQQTKTYIIAIFERINHIFKNTIFETYDRAFTNYGMQIRTVVVHTTPSHDYEDYNNDKHWDVNEMLDAFGYGTEGLSEKWSDYCLAHLYTNNDFNEGVLGLAYVASPISNKVGGICSAPYMSQVTFRKRMLNIGLSTSVNYGRTLLSSELELVSAHEIGHNWGSSHDPDNADVCAPYNDHFLMYPSAVDGSRPNNKLFSPCSTTAIGSVLKYKSDCFTEMSTSFCGNGIIEENEDCDPGDGSLTSDPCCTDTCHFTAGSVCSDKNTDCCRNCQFAGPDTACYQFDPDQPLDIINGCIKTRKCGVNSPTCDVIEYKTEGEPCFDQGSCDARGNCVSFCEAKGMTSCQGVGNVTCHWTCRHAPLSPCDEVFELLPDGKPCPNGVCVSGICAIEPQTQVKIWNILSGLTPNLFWNWMKNNVVLVVILLTSIFWVPLSILVAWLDRAQDEVDYYETVTLKRRKDGLNKQMSTVSSKSFEMHTIVSMPLHNPGGKKDVFTLTGQEF